MMERLPLSIKVDNESSLYTELIQPKRDSRELTSFIVQLLELYHENEAVKEMMSKHIMDNNPYTDMQERLKEINRKHERNVTNRTFISQYTEVEKGKAEEEYQRKSSEEPREETRQSSKGEIENLVELLLPKLQEALQSPQRVEEKDLDGTAALHAEIKRLREQILKNEEGGSPPVPVVEEEPVQSVEKVEKEPSIGLVETKAPEAPTILVGGDETLFEVEKAEERTKVSSAFSKMSKSL